MLDEWRNAPMQLFEEGTTRAVQLPFIRSFLSTLLPITAQALMASSRTVFDVFMTSSLGFEEVAVVGYGSRIVFILILLVLGICNGAGVIIAQYYGGGSIPRAKAAIGTTILLSVVVALFGFGIVLALSGYLATWAANDQAVQSLALDYLIPASAMVIPFSVSFAIAVGLRSVGRPGLATGAAIIGLLSNIALNYALIFGNFGAPELGVKGAAYASAISFGIEAVVIGICAVVLFDRKLFSLSRMSEYLNADTMRRTLEVGLPIAFGSVVWAVGIFVYSVITAYAGAKPLAALALVTPIESMAIAVMIGLSSTTNVIVGQRLGRGDFRNAFIDAIALVLWTLVAAATMSVVLIALKPVLAVLYAGAGREVLALSNEVFNVLAIVLIFRALNVTMIVGILRSGADTTYPIIMDIVAQWLIAIPLAYLCAVTFTLSYTWVFLAINCEEIAKLFMAVWRVTRFKWLTQIKPRE